MRSLAEDLQQKGAGLEFRFPAVCMVAAGSVPYLLVFSFSKDTINYDIDDTVHVDCYVFSLYFKPTPPSVKRYVRKDLSTLLSQAQYQGYYSWSFLQANDFDYYSDALEGMARYKSFFGKIGTILPGLSGVRLLMYCHDQELQTSITPQGTAQSVLGWVLQLYSVRDQSRAHISQYGQFKQPGYQLYDMAKVEQTEGITNGFILFKKMWCELWHKEQHCPQAGSAPYSLRGIYNILNGLYNPRNAGFVDTGSAIFSSHIALVTNASVPTILQYTLPLAQATQVGQIAPFVGLVTSLAALGIAQREIGAIKDGRRKFLQAISSVLSQSYHGRFDNTIAEQMHKIAYSFKSDRATAAELQAAPLYMCGRSVLLAEILTWFLGKEARRLHFQDLEQKAATAQFVIGLTGAILAFFTAGISLIVSGVLAFGVSGMRWTQRTLQARTNAATIRELVTEFDKEIAASKQLYQRAYEGLGQGISVDAIKFHSDDEAEYEVSAAFVEKGFIALGNEYKSIFHKKIGVTVGDYMRAKLAYLIVEAKVAYKKMLKSVTPEESTYFFIIFAIARYYHYEISKDLERALATGENFGQVFFNEVERLCGVIPRG